MSLTRLFFASFSAVLITVMTTVSPNGRIANQSYQNTQSAESTTQLAIAQNQQQSRNWAGYETSYGTFTGVEATWKVSSNNTPSNYGIDATWVGIGGVNSNDLIQAGTQQTIDGNGVISYEAFYEMLPEISQPIDLSIEPGNSITASVIKKSGNKWQIQVKNNTTGQSIKIGTTYASTLSSAEWIEEAPSGIRTVLPLDNFGTVIFKNATAIENGQKVTLVSTKAQPISMSDDVGLMLAKTTVIDSSGTSFAVTRTNTSSINELQSRGGAANLMRRLGLTR